MAATTTGSKRSALEIINDTLRENGKQAKEDNALARDSLADFLKQFEKRLFDKATADRENAKRNRLADIEKNRESSNQSKGLIGNSLSGAGDMAKGVGSGIGDIFKGLGAAGAGIGAFFLALAGAEAIMSKFGDGERLKNLLTNLATGLGSFGAPAILALGGLFVGAALFGKVAGVGGSFKGGFGIAAIGAGIAAFLVEMSVADALIERWGGDGAKLTTFMTNFGAALGTLGGPAIATLGGLFAGGALFGQVAGFGSWKGGFGIAAIGAGIAAFFVELAVADLAISKLGASGDWLSNFVTAISTSIASLGGISGSVLAGLFATGGIFGLVAGPVGAGKAVIGIAAIGAGIAAFFTALAGGDFAIEKMQATGMGLKTLVGNIVDSINLFDAKTAAVIGGLIAVGGIFGPAMIGAGVGIAAIGLAIGLFFAGIGAGDAMITAMSNLTGGAPGEGFKNLIFNTVEGIKKFGELKDMPDMSKVSAGLVSLSGAMLAFFGVDGIAKLQGVAEEVGAKIGSVFDVMFGTNIEGEMKKGVVERLIEGLEPLKTLDMSVLTQMDQLSASIKGLVSAFIDLSNIKADGLTTGISSMLRGIGGLLMAKDALINGGAADMGAWGYGDNINFGAGLKNFTEENMNEISDGVKRLYAAMNISMPTTGAQLSSAAASTQGQGAGTALGIGRIGDDNIKGGDTVINNFGLGGPLSAYDNRVGR